MTLAIRRCSRVGRFDGKDVTDDPEEKPGSVPLEDLGVKADVFYEAESIDDVIAGKPGILRRACQDLGKAGAFRVDAGNTVLLDGGSVTVDVQTVNIESLKFLLDGYLTGTAEGGSRTVTVPAASGIYFPSVLRIEGYATVDGAIELVRSRTIQLQAPVNLDSGAAGGLGLNL